MTKDQAAKATAFRSLHEGPHLFVMPNAWDSGSARFLAAAGFSAIGTTSGGVNWRMGREDYVYTTPADVMLEEYGRIAEAVEIPVSGDLENGYGADPETVAETIRQSIAHGMVGGSIEDSTAEPRQPLYEIGLAVDRIRAARRAADEGGMPYTLTARCEVYWRPSGPLRRGRAEIESLPGRRRRLHLRPDGRRRGDNPVSCQRDRRAP